jgi:hypothetical protein
MSYYERYKTSKIVIQLRGIYLHGLAWSGFLNCLLHARLTAQNDDFHLDLKITPRYRFLKD